MTNLKCINFYKKTLAPLQMLTVVLNNFILICLEKKRGFYLQISPCKRLEGRTNLMGFKTSEIFLEYNNLRLFITFNILVKTIQ